MKSISLVLGLLLFGQAIGQTNSTERKYIVLPRPAAVQNAPFSEGVLAGDTLYVAGQIGMDPTTGKPGGTPEQEARLAMEAVKRVVTQAGLNMDDLVSVQVFCSDVANFDAFNGVYRTYFHGNFPARAFLGSGTLLFGARYEVNGIAIKRDVAGMRLVK